MNTQDKKQQLIGDILKLDPQFKQHEAELEKIIDKLLSAKPNVPFDENFRQQLRAQILQKIESKKHVKNPSLWTVMSPWKKLAISGSFLALVVIISGMVFFSSQQYKTQDQKIAKKEPSLVMIPDQEIVQREESAFGQLNSNSASQEVPTREGLGAESGSGSFSSRSASNQSSEAMIGVLPSKRFTFSYIGKNIQINQTKSEVLRRIKGSSISSFQQIISSFDDSLIDFRSFSEAQLQTFNFIEDRPFGFAVHVSVQDGSISVNQNWQRWESSGQEAVDFRQRQTLDNLPADEMLIAVADDFIQRYGLNMTNFEPAIVDKQWQNQQMQDGELSSFYIPSNISVIYPLKIDEREVHNQSGTREGLRVNVNVPLMRVSGAYGITTQKYESSLYATETDYGKLVEIAENGGTLYPMPLLERNTDQQEIVTLKLDTPTFAFIKHWHYTGSDTQELIAPALLFPVVDAKQNGYHQDRIVVPIIKDLLRKNY